MKKTVVFFDFMTSGHHLEYFYHINKNCNLLIVEKIFFYVNHDFEYLFNEKFGVKIKPNISVISLNKYESELYSKLNKISKYKYDFKKVDIFLKEFSVDTLFLMDIYPLSFFLWFYNLKVSISGIYYIPILKTSNLFSDKFKRFILKWSLIRNNWKKILVLNNNEIIKDLNLDHKVNLFDTIADPILNIKDLLLQSDEKKIHNFTGKTTFLHIGGIEIRKGTLDILQSLTKLTGLESLQFDVIIAGITSIAFAQKINEEIEKLKLLGIQNVHFYNKSLSYKEFDHLIDNCTYVLLPYKTLQMSSGVLNHAINYNKPIIGSSKGLMGSIIEEFKVGVSIEKESNEIVDVIRKLLAEPYICDWSLSKDYLNRNSSTAFVDKINSLLS